jgi:tight adherence protein C
MFAFIIQKLTEPGFVATILTAIAAAAAVLTVALPFLERDNLGERIKSVGVERERIRQRERERLAKQGGNASLRGAEAKPFMRQIVDDLKLNDWLGSEGAKLKMTQAGYRGQSAEVAFLFFRLVTPIGLFLFAMFYLFVLEVIDQPGIVKFIIAVGAGFVGLYGPQIFLTNQIQKRQTSIKRAWPDSLDLMLICVESGMSIEAAFRKVSTEVGQQSLPLAEELTLATAELSYLPERRQAYENLSIRTGLEGVKSVCTALVQAERYGTPVGTALRVLAQENRDQRMTEAEKKAAALPPKLTVPMIIFFLPPLFGIILTPALIQVFNWN